MKTIYPIIILAGALCSLAPALPPNVLGPAQVAIRGVGQNLSGAQISARTNIVGGTTNFTEAYKSTTTNFTMDAGSLFALLENSFHTNFPAGCQLLLATYQGNLSFRFVVSDSTGTNAGFDPGQVLSSSYLSSPVPVTSGVFTETSTNNPGGEIVGGQDAESYTTALTFTYDDSAMTNTADGTHTKFKWVGLVHDKSLESFHPTSVFYNENVVMEVIGTGLIRLPTNAVPSEKYTAVFTGSIGAKVSGP